MLDLLSKSFREELTENEQKRLDKEMIAYEKQKIEDDERYLKFKCIPYYAGNDEQKEYKERAMNYTKNNFLTDISNRLKNVLSIKDIDNFKDILSNSYDEMYSKSNVLFIDTGVIRFSFSPIISAYKDKKDLQDAARTIQSMIESDIYDNLKHRFVLEDIMKEQFKDISFELNKNESKWNGFEIGDQGGFGSRTTYKSLEYMLEEQGVELKENIFCSIAVYFIEMLRAKQSKEYRNLLLGETNVFNGKTLLNIMIGLNKIKKTDLFDLKEQ